MMQTLENRVAGRGLVNWAIIPLYAELRKWIQDVGTNEKYWYKELIKPDPTKHAPPTPRPPTPE